MKHRTHKPTAKAVAAILCATLMLTACGSKETTSNETAVTETTSVESTEMTSTEAAVAEPTAEPAETPTESETAPTETPAESPAPAVEPTAAPVESTAVSTGYTYSELSQTMYAKSAVNVRDLPSTDGKKIGSLKASQEITVTGKCDQTGWYRFELNNTTGYVSDKYIVSEKPAVNTVAAMVTAILLEIPRSRIPQHLRLHRQLRQRYLVQKNTSTVLWQNRYSHWSITTV